MKIAATRNSREKHKLGHTKHSLVVGCGCWMKLSEGGGVSLEHVVESSARDHEICGSALLVFRNDRNRNRTFLHQIT